MPPTHRRSASLSAPSRCRAWPSRVEWGTLGPSGHYRGRGSPRLEVDDHAVIGVEHPRSRGRRGGGGGGGGVGGGGQAGDQVSRRRSRSRRRDALVQASRAQHRPAAGLPRGVRPDLAGDAGPPRRSSHVQGSAAPARRPQGRGAGSLLLDAAEARARELAADAAAGEPVWAETAHLVGDPEGAAASRRPRLRDAPHLPPHDHRPRAGDPARRGPTASSCGRSIPSATPGSSRTRSTRPSPMSGATRGATTRHGPSACSACRSSTRS